MDYTFNNTEINRLFTDVEHVFNDARVNIKLASLLHNRATTEQMDELQELTNRAVSLLTKIRLEDGADVRKAVSHCLSVYGRYLDNLDTPPDIVEVVGLSEEGIMASRKDADIHPSWNRYNGKLRSLADILQPFLSFQPEQIKEQRKQPEQPKTAAFSDFLTASGMQYQTEIKEVIRPLLKGQKGRGVAMVLNALLHKRYINLQQGDTQRIIDVFNRDFETKISSKQAVNTYLNYSYEIMLKHEFQSVLDQLP